jgi:hypothetical protein
MAGFEVTPYGRFYCDPRGKKVYFRQSDLEKLPRTEATLSDPASGLKHRYEGVWLESLVPAGMVSGTKSIDVSYDRHESMTISSSDIEPATEPMVVDTIDGEKLGGSS